MNLQVVDGGDAGSHAPLLGAIHLGSFDAGWGKEEIGRLVALPGSFVVVASIEQSPFGFVLVRTAADEAEIITLAVLPDRRRRGVGRSLVEAALAEIRRRGCRAMFLEVACDNEPAQRLYQACAFREVGRRRRYYARGSEPPVDAVIMRRDFGR